MGAFNLDTCARPNILELEPYRCARDDYKDDGTNILLDANENAFGPSLHIPAPVSSSTESSGTAATSTLDAATTNAALSVDFLGLNRYPDPHQIELKQLFCNLRNSGAHSSKPLTPDNLFIGVGSDEAIDAVLRVFGVPGKDKILICPPTYGMYTVSAHVNDVSLVKVPLNTDGNFQLRPDAINAALSADPSIKAVIVCSPGNPTGELLRKEDIRAILEHPTWNGLVIVDEAYIDFADDPSTASLATWVLEWPNLMVMQTLSKAFGLAGVRVGVAFTDARIARLLNCIKAPYNISSPSSAVAVHALQKASLEVMQKSRRSILEQRARLISGLEKIKGVGRVRGGAAANFVLVEMLQPPYGRDSQAQAQAQAGTPSNEVALAVYERLAERRNVVVRFRGKEQGCLGCLRITVGTQSEMDKLLADLDQVLRQLDQDSGSQAVGHLRNVTSAAQETAQEIQANEVVA